MVPENVSQHHTGIFSTQRALLDKPAAAPVRGFDRQGIVGKELQGNRQKHGGFAK
jgi:hypothetical protein